MKGNSSDTQRRTVAVRLRRIAEKARELWDEGVRANELMLARPWEREGPLRWQRDLGGRRLVGREVPGVPDDAPPLDESARTAPEPPRSVR